MTAEQQGVSPATAGGASAPGPWDIGHSPATGGRNLYVRDADGDVYVGVIFEPADARRIVEAMNAAERPRLAAPRDAEIEQLRTALTRYQKRLGDDLLCGGKLVERVRAALRVDNGSTCIRASMDGVAGDVGRLCDETERLRLEVASARSIADEKRAVAEELRNEADGRKDERDEARKKLYEIRALALRELDFDDEAAASEPTSELVLEIARRWHGMQAGIERLRAELDGQRADKEQAEAAHDRLRARLDQHLADENSAQAVSDRLRQELDLQHADRLRWLCEALNVNPANETWLTAMRRVRHLRQNFSDSPRCEVAESDGWRCRLFAGHDGKRLAQMPTGERREWPFDNRLTPRYWRVGDPEPEIGTTVWRRAERYRRSSNGWHHVGDFTGYASWAWILSVGSEVVEAVSTDG